MLSTHRILLLLTVAATATIAHASLRPLHVAAAPMHTLNVQPTNVEAGQNLELATITSSPAGIICGQGNNQCSAQFEEGIEVTLTGTGVKGSEHIRFQWFPVTYWHGSPEFFKPHLKCAAMSSMGNMTSNVCTAPMPNDDVVIRFAAQYTHSLLTVLKRGTGSGIVANQNPVKDPLLINCGSACSADIYDNLILFAIPDPGSVFAGWEVDGGSIADCGPTNYAAKCLASIQVNLRGNGASAMYSAVFNQAVSNKANPSAPSTTNNTTPLAPKIDIAVGDRKILDRKNITFNHDEIITLTGRAMPSGIITLYVHSEPKKYEIIANKDGNWSFNITSLAPGKHRIESELTDPVTNKTSPRNQVLSFTVLPAPYTASKTATSMKANAPSTVALFSIAVLLFVCFVGLALFIKKRSTSKKPAKQSSKK